ncbi:hypothetical protein THAOC_05487, partial [Thalassiosira oceanica]
MAENVQGETAVGTDQTCGICLEDSKDPLTLPCGHSFCNGCLNEWRSRYGVEVEMRRKCPICRARIPPSKEMVATLLMLRNEKQQLEYINDTSSENYHRTCRCLKEAEERVGADWDGVTTVLEDNDDKHPVVIPDYIFKAVRKGGIKTVLKWINANRAEDRVNAVSSAETLSLPVLTVTTTCNQLAMMTQLLQLGANVDGRTSFGGTAIASIFVDDSIVMGYVCERVRLLLSWGAITADNSGAENCISSLARMFGKHELAKLLESELGGRRCEIANLPSRPELNGKTCVVDEYLPGSNEYKVTLETKSKEVLVLGPDNLTRRDRTPQDCGYYIEFKNGRTIRHDFDSSEDCKAFVASLNSSDETPPAVTEEVLGRSTSSSAATDSASTGMSLAPLDQRPGVLQDHRPFYDDPPPRIGSGDFLASELPAPSTNPFRRLSRPQATLHQRVPSKTDVVRPPP